MLAAGTYGTNDVFYWERFLKEANALGGIGLYRADAIFIHPPFIVHYIQALGWVADRTGVPFRFWLRAVSSLADIGTFFAVARLGRMGAERIGAVGLSLLAVAPASIMIAGFHGNTDPLMVMFAVVAVLLAVAGRPGWMVGVAIGMALNVKFAAVLFTPALFFYLPSWGRRFELAAAAAATVLISGIPYVLEDPLYVLVRITSYGSLTGHWGLTRLAPMAGMDGRNPLFGFYLHWGALGIMLALLILAIAVNRRSVRPSLFIQCGVSALVFMVFTPGFGVQYLAWLVPWVAAAGLVPALAFYSLSGLFLFLVYGYWAQHFPWYYANSLVVGDWKGRRLVGAEITTWLAVMTALVVLSRRLRTAGNRDSRPSVEKTA